MSPINEARQRLADAGVGHDVIMWSDEVWQRNEGTCVVERLPDGRVRSAIQERGTEHDVEFFPDEQTAADKLERQYMVLARPKQEKP